MDDAGFVVPPREHLGVVGDVLHATTIRRDDPFRVVEEIVGVDDADLPSRHVSCRLMNRRLS